jgi:hypothetical protein
VIAGLLSFISSLGYESIGRQAHPAQLLAALFEKVLSLGQGKADLLTFFDGLDSRHSARQPHLLPVPCPDVLAL